jgi:uncharacterized membrane protein
VNRKRAGEWGLLLLYVSFFFFSLFIKKRKKKKKKKKNKNKFRLGQDCFFHQKGQRVMDRIYLGATISLNFSTLIR